MSYKNSGINLYQYFLIISFTINLNLNFISF